MKNNISKEIRKEKTMKKKEKERKRRNPVYMSDPPNMQNSPVGMGCPYTSRHITDEKFPSITKAK